MGKNKRSFFEKDELSSKNDPDEIPDTGTGRQIDKGDQPALSNNEKTIRENKSTKPKS